MTSFEQLAWSFSHSENQLHRWRSALGNDSADHSCPRAGFLLTADPGQNVKNAATLAVCFWSVGMACLEVRKGTKMFHFSSWKKVSAGECGRKKAQMIRCLLHDRPNRETNYWGREEPLTYVFIFDYLFDCAILVVALGIFDRHCNMQGLWLRHANS